jgi:NADPH:quinone reductase
MKAWLLDDLLGIDHLRLADVADAAPAPGEVVLQIRYAGLNPADRYLAERQYPAKPPLPHILGRDGLGTVVQLGPGASGVEVGEVRAILRGEVGVTRHGTFAERTAVSTDYLIPPPAGWTEEETAGAPLVYLTAYQALTMWGPLPPSAVVLVTGASGGVGVASVQLAAAMGCTVLALSRSPEKSSRLRELGAFATYDPEDPEWTKQAKAAVAPRRIQLGVDNIGGKLLPEVISTLGDRAVVSLVGRLAGPVPSFNTATLFAHRLRLGGVAVGAYTLAESQAAWTHIIDLLARRNARPLVDGIFAFDELPKAFARLARGPMGKVLLRVGSRP